MIRKTIQVDISSCQQAKFLRCSLAINYHLFNSLIIAQYDYKGYQKVKGSHTINYSNSFDETDVTIFIVLIRNNIHIYIFIV